MFVPNYKCDTQDNLAAVIGGLESETSQQIADVVGIYNIPQVQFPVGWYGSTHIMYTFFSR